MPSSVPMRPGMRRACALALLLPLSGCVYFNTFFNAEKAYAQALRMREKRLDRNPDDSVAVSPEERLKLERAINKSSKVLELYPGKLAYAPKALFLMGESYLLMGEYIRAVQKYEELLRYYPQAEEAPLAEIHRAQALYHSDQILKARAVVEEILSRKPEGAVLREALLLAAKMDADGEAPEAALGHYERLLGEKGLQASARAEAHWQAARLAFELGQWERARKHALASERKLLATRFRYRNEKLAVQCLYKLGRFRDGIDEVKAMSRFKAFGPFRADLTLLLAQGYAGAGDWAEAEKNYREVPALAPRTAAAAEAFYRLAEKALDSRREDSARVLFDSAAAAGEMHEFGRLGAEKAAALARLAELRKAPPPEPSQPHYQDFMIAELFLFRLSQVDSALRRLDRIVTSPAVDSVHSLRAAYARAFIHEEFRGDKAAGDSLYRYVLERYPGTEWAQQAEKNLGLKPTVETREDKAHALFLEAEALRFGGEDLEAKVIPAYRTVAEQFPSSRHAAKALFVVAFLSEDLARRDPPPPDGLEKAKAAYREVSSRYPETPYGEIAQEKLSAAGVPESSPPPSTAPATPAPAPAAPAAPTAPDPKSAAPETPPAAPSQPSQPAKPQKESLEPSYEDVDVY